jgi:hypothetical protein
MVTRAMVSTSIAGDVQKIDIAETALLDEPVELQKGEAGTAKIVTDRPGWIEVVTSSASRQLLILSESYHPGWQATEEGRPIKIIRAYGDFQASVVEPGERRIIFRFRPASFLTGAWISSLGVGLAFIVFVFVLRFPRLLRSNAGDRRKPATDPDSIDRLGLRPGSAVLPGRQ